MGWAYSVSIEGGRLEGSKLLASFSGFRYRQGHSVRMKVKTVPWHEQQPKHEAGAKRSLMNIDGVIIEG